MDAFQQISKADIAGTKNVPFRSVLPSELRQTGLLFGQHYRPPLAAILLGAPLGFPSAVVGVQPNGLGGRQQQPSMGFLGSSTSNKPPRLSANMMLSEVVLPQRCLPSH